jgi:sarcosine oxidase
MEHNFDVIVLGAGAMGSAAAYHLTREQQRVLLLEQFELDHTQGSSYGPSRIIRYTYDHPTYIELSKAAYPAWRAIEEDAGETLYVRTGGLDFGPPDDAMLRSTLDNVRQMGIEHEVLSPGEAQRRFPQFRFDEDFLILYQADSGILPASQSVLTHVRLARQRGASVLTNTPVVSVKVSRGQAEVRTSSDTFTADKLVITAGPWAKSVLARLGLDLPLTPLRCQVAYFRPSVLDAYEPERFPTFIAHLSHIYGRMPYGMASYLNSGVKVAFHNGQPVAHPSEVNYTPEDEEIERIRTFTNKHLPGADAPLASTMICLYTMTPDEHFLIDKHPEHPQVVFGAGFSGHGFKFSTLIGRILADLALKGETQHDIRLFSVSRFVKV